MGNLLDIFYWFGKFGYTLHDPKTYYSDPLDRDPCFRDLCGLQFPDQGLHERSQLDRDQDSFSIDSDLYQHPHTANFRGRRVGQ